jgi:hypothetical protein
MRHLTLAAWWALWTPHRWLRGILVRLALCSTPVGMIYALGSAAMDLPRRIAIQGGKLTAGIIATPLWQVMQR